MKLKLFSSFIVIFIIVACVDNNKKVVHFGKLQEGLPINSFQYTGDWIACHSDTQDDLACFHIGKLKIGDPYQPSREPSQNIDQPKGVVASVFPIIKKENQEAYWVIGHKEGKIVSIQLTGNYGKPELSFSSIILGDGKDKVERILGPRHTIKEFQDNGINGVLWDYAPFQFSFEFVNGKVYSMRVTN